VRFPEALYQLTDYDVNKASWAPQRVAVAATTAAAAIQLSVAYGPVPADRIWVVTAAAVEGRAGAAQTCSRLALRVTDETGSTEAANTAVERSVLQNDALSFSGEFIVMPGEFLRGLVDFSAAVAINSVFFSVTGMLLARANLQRGSLPAA